MNINIYSCCKCGCFVYEKGKVKEGLSCPLCHAPLRHRVYYDKEKESINNNYFKNLAPSIDSSACKEEFSSDYKIIFKEEFVRRYLFKRGLTKSNVEKAHELWEKMRDGYEFVIGLGSYCCSFSYFNENIIGDKNA
ncbi:TPA: hypothetical protein ACY4RU_000503 [Clostridium perfringens]